MRIIITALLSLSFTAFAVELTREYYVDRSLTEENINGEPSFIAMLSEVKGFVRENKQSGDYVPSVIGIQIPADIIQKMPAYPGKNITTFELLRNDESELFTDQTLCFDVNSDESIEPESECATGYRSFIPLKQEGMPRPDQPYEFIQFAWNPKGYADSNNPSNIYATPLFGIHFYFTTREEIDEIQVGNVTITGKNLILDETSLANARQTIPPELLPPGAIQRFTVPKMGSHLIIPGILSASSMSSGSNTPDFTIVYGANKGRPVFIEPIVFRPFLESILSCQGFPFSDFNQADPMAEHHVNGESSCKAEICKTLPLPDNFVVGGYYPNDICVTYDNSTMNFEVTMQNFTLFDAYT